MKYGCHNRPPFVPAYKSAYTKEWIASFGAQTCQYTLSEIGAADKKCDGCKHKKEAHD